MLSEEEAWEGVKDRVKERIVGHGEAVGYNVEAAMDNLRDLAAALHTAVHAPLSALTMDVLRGLSATYEKVIFLGERLEEEFGSDEGEDEAC